MISEVSSALPKYLVSSLRPASVVRSIAMAINTVRFPSRKSSPAGLPVTAGSPKIPKRSSRSWNASPSGSPYSDNLHVSGVRTVGSRRAIVAPRCNGRSMLYLPDLNRAMRSERSTLWLFSPASRTSRYWPAINSIRISSWTTSASSN